MDEVNGSFVRAFTGCQIREAAKEESEPATKLIKLFEDTLALLFRGIVELPRWLVVAEPAARLEDLRPDSLVFVVDRF